METLIVHDFRGLHEFAMSFTPGVNIIVGDNACGKTSVLKAVKYALSSFFSGFNDENTTWLSPGNDDFRLHTIGDWEAPSLPISIEFSLAPMLLDASLIEWPDKLLEVRKNSPKNSRNLVGGIIPLRDYGRLLKEKLYTVAGEDKQRTIPLPLFDSISTVYTHVDKKIPQKKFLSPSTKPTLGYLGCLTGGGFGSHWWQRIKVLSETRRRLWEVEGVKNAICDALGPNGCGIISDINPVVSLNEIFVNYTDGREVTYDLLPDGYLRLVDIVINLAFRALLLNGELYGAEAPRLTSGTVLIDEIDLHLHPSLQALVVKGLHNAFPRLQFIATSHSPRVMGGVENTPSDQVVRLQNENGLIISTQLPSFGLDVNAILDLLGLQVRDAEVQSQLVRLFDLIDNGMNMEAQELIDQMRSRFGNTLPDLTEAETLLSLNDFGDGNC